MPELVGLRYAPEIVLCCVSDRTNLGVTHHAAKPQIIIIIADANAIGCFEHHTVGLNPRNRKCTLEDKSQC